jgi:hypothetical protein
MYHSDSYSATLKCPVASYHEANRMLDFFSNIYLPIWKVLARWPDARL